MRFDLMEILKKTGIGLLQIVKAELITSLICFIILLIGLGYAEVPLYGLVAFIIALVDLLPILGAGVILIPWAIIALLTGNGKLALILIILFIVCFLVNQILEPIILGRSVGLKPIYTLAITLVSMIVFGPGAGAIIGAIISVLIAVLMDLREAKTIYEDGDQEIYMDIDYEIKDEKEDRN